LVGLVGEPLADPAWVPTALLARRAAQDVKVALVGEGGDELFGGYPTYIGAQAAEYYARIPRVLRAAIRRAVTAWPPSDKKVAVSFLLKRFVQGAELDGVVRHLLWTSNISPSLLKRLGVPSLEPAVVERAGRALLDIVQQNDLETSLAEGLLTKADRASMRSALELRAPFLDQAVMEFAATLPGPERVRGLTTKTFLKRYALRYLPPSIVHRRKRGLSVPLANWLRGPLYEWAEDRLRSDRLATVGILNRAAVELLEEHRQRRADHARALWTLIVLSEWLAWASKREQK
jgi:asparagine synthase (glutamine-hydrolysing)